METRRCKICGEVKFLSMFYKRKDGSYLGRSAACKSCTLKIKKAYCLNNKDSINIYHKEWRNKNKSYSKEYYNNNLKQVRSRQAGYNQIKRDSLHNEYIIARLGLNKKDCTPEIIELKREQLKLFRAVKR